MILVKERIIPPKEWIHDPNIKDKYNNTVANKLKYNNLPVPNEWYDEKMKNTLKNPYFIE